MENEIDVIALDERGTSYHVVKQPHSAFVTDEEKANARLIAAAPDLLFALDTLLMGARYSRTLRRGWAFQNAQSTIRKAVGEAAVVEVPPPPNILVTALVYYLGGIISALLAPLRWWHEWRYYRLEHCLNCKKPVFAGEAKMGDSYYCVACAPKMEGSQSQR